MQGISCCCCRSISVFQQVGVSASFLSSPSRLSSFKHFPVRQAKYACHVGTRPRDAHQLLLVSASPSTAFHAPFSSGGPAARAWGPCRPSVCTVGAQTLPGDRAASPHLRVHSTRTCLSPAPARTHRLAWAGPSLLHSQAWSGLQERPWLEAQSSAESGFQLQLGSCLCWSPAAL